MKFTSRILEGWGWQNKRSTEKLCTFPAMFFRWKQTENIMVMPIRHRLKRR
jgi:hypothetical protein